MEGCLTIRESIERYIGGCPAKVQTSALRLFFKAVLAGMMIALGACASSMAAHSITNAGVARLVAGAVFPVGLMMVVLTGAELFTGDCLASMAVMDGRCSLLRLIRLLVLVYLGNLAGGLLTAGLVVLSGQLDTSGGLLGAYTIKVALGKVNLSFAQGVASGILCNILVCIAVIMALCARNVSGKLLSCFFAVMLFVTAGFEHCVANMYYIPAGMLAMTRPTCVSAAAAWGITPQQLTVLTPMSFILKNLLPVTLGNLIGGILCVAAPLYHLNKVQK